MRSSITDALQACERRRPDHRLLCRADHINDPAKAKAFEDKFGYKLDVPKTWKEYYNLAKFMHDPSKGFYGNLEYRSPYYVKWMFMQRRPCLQGAAVF